MLWHIYGGQRITCQSLSSPSSMLDLGIELRPSGWVISAFPHWAPLRPCEYISYVLYDYISAHIIVLTNESKCIHLHLFTDFVFTVFDSGMIETLNHWALGLLFEGAFIIFRIQGIQRNWHVHSQEAENTVSYPVFYHPFTKEEEGCTRSVALDGAACHLKDTRGHPWGWVTQRSCKVLF